MNNPLSLASIAVLLLCFLASCTIEKRKYLPGYNVQWKNSKPERKHVADSPGIQSGKRNSLIASPTTGASQAIETETASIGYSTSRRNHSRKRPGSQAMNLPEACDEVILK